MSDHLTLVGENALRDLVIERDKLRTENQLLRRVADAARVAVDDWYFDGSYKDLRLALAALPASTEGESDA